jgi:type IV fimbrial biogenesis protein FimT
MKVELELRLSLAKQQWERINSGRQTNARGFTLVELMVTIAIAAILTALAVPTFTRFIRQGQYTSAANELVTGFNYARNEAIQRQRPVSVAAKTGGWVNGWQAFLDTNRNAAFDGADVVLREGNAITGIDVVGVIVGVAFDQNGRRSNVPATAFISLEVSKTGGPADLVRRVCVARNGRISTVNGATACV